jgi:hypothetical protein
LVKVSRQQPGGFLLEQGKRQGRPGESPLEPASPVRKRQGTAALQDASRLPRRWDWATAFGLRQSSGAMPRARPSERPSEPPLESVSPIRKRWKHGTFTSGCSSSVPAQVALMLYFACFAAFAVHPHYSFQFERASAMENENDPSSLSSAWRSSAGDPLRA